MLEMTFGQMVFQTLLISSGLILLYYWDNRKRFKNRDPSLLSGRMMTLEIIIAFSLLFAITLTVHIGLKALEFYFVVIKAPGGFYP